jgi:hypothetical protein
MNGYEKSFIKWFRRDGWMIRGTDVWHQDCDGICPYKLTRPMVQRLEAEGILLRIYPDNAPIWLECYDLESRYKNLCWEDFERRVFGTKTASVENPI